MLSRKSLRQQIDFIHAGEGTKRYHTVRTIKDQTVGAHSFSVIWLVYMLTSGNADVHLLMAGAVHDLAENFAGDMPSPAKRVLDIGEAVARLEGQLLREHSLNFLLSPADVRILKMADRMSGILFCIEERTMGNVGITTCFNNFLAYIRELQPVGIEAEILEVLVNKWWEVQV